MNTGNRIVGFVAVILALVAFITVVSCASASPSSPVPTSTPTPIPQPAVLKELNLGDWVMITGGGGAHSLECYGANGWWLAFGDGRMYGAKCDGITIPPIPKIGAIAKVTLNSEEGQWKNGDAIYACAGYTCGWFPISSLGVGVTPTPTLLEMFPPTEIPTPTPTPSPTPTCVHLHKVVAGDTLLGIAQANGLDVVQLGEWNNLRYPYVIYVGTYLKLCPK